MYTIMLAHSLVLKVMGRHVYVINMGDYGWLNIRIITRY
jgi:hypothetical protein